MNYYIIQLASANNTLDGKERLLILPIPVTNSDIVVTPTQKNLLTISKAEFDREADNYFAYRQKLINECKTELSKTPDQLAN